MCIHSVTDIILHVIQNFSKLPAPCVKRLAIPKGSETLRASSTPRMQHAGQLPTFKAQIIKTKNDMNRTMNHNNYMCMCESI